MRADSQGAPGRERTPDPVPECLIPSLMLRMSQECLLGPRAPFSETGTISPSGIQSVLPPCQGTQHQRSLTSSLKGCIRAQVTPRAVHPGLLDRPTLSFPSSPLRPVHPEDSTEHAQKQRQLQEDQEQKVETADQRPWVEG